LPQKLAQTLKRLDDADLETLHREVEAEMRRRGLGKSGEVKRDAPAPPPTATSGSMIPAGKASLIRASYQAGLKPLAIARTLRVSQALVNQVLGTHAKAKR
jgi:hypothetical protein